MRVDKNQYYKPIDSKYRGGLKARVISVDRKNRVVRYATGGQVYPEDIDEFLKKYKLTTRWG
jgi:hypothetical protein